MSDFLLYSRRFLFLNEENAGFLSKKGVQKEGASDGKFTCALIGLDILFWKSPPVSSGERSKGIPISDLSCSAMGMEQSSRSYMSRKPLAASMVIVSIHSNAASCSFQLKFNYGNLQVK